MITMKYLVTLFIVLTAHVAAAELNNAEKAALLNARKEVTRNLKDPDSALFRNVYLIVKKGSDKYFVCGEINAKNYYGGYVGYDKFSATGNGKVHFLYSEGNKKLIDVICDKTKEGYVVIEEK